MVPTTSGQAFAAASAAMVRGDDGASTVHALLADCMALLGADTAGVLVRVGEHGLEMLAATSHEAAELELFQSQVRHGPCVDAIESGESVSVSGAEAVGERWPDFSTAMAGAGLQSVHAIPMRWHREVLGGVNLFWRGTPHLTDADRELAQAFADICSLALMQRVAPEDSAASVAQQVRAALEGRVVIERAKGVLAQTDGLDMGRAFARLVDLSHEQSRPLSEVAQGVLDEIVARRRA